MTVGWLLGRGEQRVSKLCELTKLLQAPASLSPRGHLSNDELAEALRIKPALDWASISKAFSLTLRTSRIAAWVATGVAAGARTSWVSLIGPFIPRSTTLTAVANTKPRFCS